ncbi:P-loop NTPase [Thermodesulfobacteriota bacterium]
MPLFHCPIGATLHGEPPCIDCGLCYAQTKEEMVESTKKIRTYLKSPDRPRPNATRKIAVCGKGGAGKSTVTALLASVLQDEAFSILVMDTDDSNPGLFRLFGFDQEPKPLMKLLDRFSIGEEKPPAGWLELDEITLQDIPPEFTLSHDGLKFLMVGKIEDPFEGCACSMGDITRDFIDRLILADKEMAVIDTEAGVESFGRGVERSVDTVLIVVEPTFESMALAEKINYMAEGIGVNKINAILNKIPSGKIESATKTELLKKDVWPIGTIFLDQKITEDSFLGKPVGESQAKEDMKKIVNRLLTE